MEIGVANISLRFFDVAYWVTAELFLSIFISAACPLSKCSFDIVYI